MSTSPERSFDVSLGFSEVVQLLISIDQRIAFLERLLAGAHKDDTHYLTNELETARTLRRKAQGEATAWLSKQEPER